MGNLVVIIKRLRDINERPVLCISIFSQIINFFMYCILISIKGKDQNNQIDEMELNKKLAILIAIIPACIILLLLSIVAL